MKNLTQTIFIVFIMLFSFSCGCNAQNIKISQIKGLQDTLNQKASAAQLNALESEVDAIPIVNLDYPDANTIEIAPGEAIQLDPSTLEINGDGQLTVIGGTGGGSGGLFEPDGNGDLMPNDAEVIDDNFELDGNGDIQPL